MENFSEIFSLIIALILTGLLMGATNGPKTSTSFGSRMTDKEYPIFIYIFVIVLILTALFILFKL